MSGPAVEPARFGPRQAQPLENFLGDARAIIQDLFGRADPKDMPPFARAAIEQSEHIKAIAARLFAPNSEGEELLEAWCDAVLRRPFILTQPGMTLEQAALHAAAREGQAQAVYLLLAWIAEGRSEQPPQREGAIHVNRTKRARRKTRR